MSAPIHFTVQSGGDVYTGFLYPDSGRFSLDCNGSFVGTGRFVAAGARGAIHGLGDRHRAAVPAIAAALAERSAVVADAAALPDRRRHA